MPQACFLTQGQYVGLPGKIGSVNIKNQAPAWFFSYLYEFGFSCCNMPQACFLTQGQYVGLPGKIGNANTKNQAPAYLFSYLYACNTNTKPATNAGVISAYCSGVDK